ncbi:MAG: Rpn family recombination-promoting nuclease/putative transposase, partial [Planctomycetes bacterium]|nr:Rpn family recombination-promoting nuclease/putative transposase [Planctomycetota bacterium]
MTYDHDALFKHTYQQPENAASLLRSILPAVLAAAIDWDSLQLLPGTSVDESLQARHADLLFTANLRGQRVLLYVVLEHKSHDDRFSVLQLLRYEIRVYDRYLQENPDATSLPPIVPIVV